MSTSGGIAILRLQLDKSSRVHTIPGPRAEPCSSLSVASDVHIHIGRRLYGGIGTALLAALQSGMQVARPCLVEVSPMAGNMAHHMREQVKQRFPAQLASAALSMVETLPSTVRPCAGDQAISRNRHTSSGVALPKRAARCCAER